MKVVVRVSGTKASEKVESAVSARPQDRGNPWSRVPETGLGRASSHRAPLLYRVRVRTTVDVEWVGTVATAVPVPARHERTKTS